MSVPTSLKVGPFTSNVLVKRKYLLFYFFLVWISTIPLFYELWWFYQAFYTSYIVGFYLFLPLMCFVMYLTLVFTSLVFAKLLLIIVSTFHKPREGVFLRDRSDKDYRYWSVRNTIKKWPLWISHKFPFPFLDNICFKVFGVKTTFSNSLFEGWVDTEFMEFGDNVVIGQAGIIQSAAIAGNLLIIRKTIIEDNVRVGAHSVVMPGTHMGKNSVLAANSVTMVGQELEEGWIYLGIPAKKFKINRFFEDNLENLIGHVGDIEKLQEVYDKLYTKRKDTE